MEAMVPLMGRCDGDGAIGVATALLAGRAQRRHPVGRS